jgi:hypothetical protein
MNSEDCEQTNDIFGKHIEGIFNSSGEFLDNKDIIKMDCDAQWLKIKERINNGIGHLSEGILLPFEKIYLENGQRLELANFSLSVDSLSKHIRVKLIRISENKDI